MTTNNIDAFPLEFVKAIGEGPTDAMTPMTVLKIEGNSVVKDPSTTAVCRRRYERRLALQLNSPSFQPEHFGLPSVPTCMRPYHCQDDVTLYHGDCRQVLQGLPADSVDAIVTDPPGGIGIMGRDWDDFRPSQNHADINRDNVFGRTSAKGPEYRRRSREAFVSFLTEVMSECLRVARPGAYALVWAIPRTSHWTATAIEDAGWVIQDRISHLFGQGFPKHKSKLKPACEDWWLAWKPDRYATPLPGLDACRIEHRTVNGGNLAENPHLRHHINGGNGGHIIAHETERRVVTPHPQGRWPANVAFSHTDSCICTGTRSVRSNGHHPATRGTGGIGTAGHAGQDNLSERHMDGETVEVWTCAEDCPVRMLDEQSGVLTSGKMKPGQPRNASKGKGGYGGGMPDSASLNGTPGDTGGASRFLYVAKASQRDRGEGNTHPTVKNSALMAWLCRLITPPGGLILDPFVGSGTTAVAAVRGGWKCIGIDQDASYLEIAKSRLEMAMAA